MRIELTEDHPFAPYHACAYLLERGLERELVLERFDAWSQLEQAKGYGGNPMASELAILALRELPDGAAGVCAGWSSDEACPIDGQPYLSSENAPAAAKSPRPTSAARQIR